MCAFVNNYGKRSSGYETLIFNLNGATINRRRYKIKGKMITGRTKCALTLLLQRYSVSLIIESSTSGPCYWSLSCGAKLVDCAGDKDGQ